MPTVLRERGYRVGFFSSEPDEPAHVHVAKAGNEAKFWIEPVSLAWSRGFRGHDLGEIANILEAHRPELIRNWNEHRNPTA
jgi:Domain of unknown function (DUF4160)